jgi:hypothetical protein
MRQRLYHHSTRHAVPGSSLCTAYTVILRQAHGSSHCWAVLSEQADDHERQTAGWLGVPGKRREEERTPLHR